MSDNNRSIMDEKIRKDLRLYKWLFRITVSVILLCLLVFCGYGCYYSHHVDGRSWIGSFEGDVYYYKAEGNFYSWTAEEGRQLLDRSEGKDWQYPEGSQECAVKYGKYVIQYEPDDETGERLIYIAENGEQVFVDFHADGHNFLASNAEYLIVHTDIYQGRQGKTMCYKIEYDDAARTVSQTRLTDVFYDLQGRW